MFNLRLIIAAILAGNLIACSYDTDALRGTLFANDAGDDAGTDAQSATDTTLPDASVRDMGSMGGVVGTGGAGGAIGTGGAPGTGGTQPTCTPVAETCNGKDDDCDGATDDGIDCVPGGLAPRRNGVTCTRDDQCGHPTFVDGRLQCIGGVCTACVGPTCGVCASGPTQGLSCPVRGSTSSACGACTGDSRYWCTRDHPCPDGSACFAPSCL